MSFSKPDQLNNPDRIKTIRSYRQAHYTSFVSEDWNLPPCTPPYEICVIRRKKSEPKEMCLKDMEKSITGQYMGRYLEGTVIEDPFFWCSVANAIVEDKNKDVVALAACGLPQDRKALKALSFGTVIRIENPVMGNYYFPSFDHADMSISWVEDPKAIMFVGRKQDVCRYCVKENAMKKCAECKRHYCDRKCQVADWTILNHRAICHVPY